MVRDLSLGKKNNLKGQLNMVMLYGQTWTKEELRTRIGHESQIGGVQQLEYTEGNQKDTSIINFRTGSGLNFQAIPSRGLDIGIADYNGKALGWRSRTGEVEPSYLGDTGVQARRGSFGGLVCTCGYSNVGVPNEDQGTLYGLHGRAQLSPAKSVRADAYWEGDEYIMYCEGKIEELDKFQEYFENRRRIETSLGSKTIKITDVLTNNSFDPQAHMMLYHCNMGFPLVGAHTKLYAPSLTSRNRDADTMDFDWKTFYPKPQKQDEEVVYHTMKDTNGMVTMALVNETPNQERWGIKFSYDISTLPRFVHWRQPSPGAYVIGLEPSNCWADGRNAHRKRDDLVILQPQETRKYHLEFTVLTSEEEVAACIAEIPKV